MNIVSFVLVWLLRKRIRCSALREFLAPYSTFSTLFILLFGDNIQYLSFRCFQQLRFIVPNSMLEWVSITMALTVLFIVVISSVSLYPLIWKFDRNFHMETIKSLSSSFLLLTIHLVLRASAGFVHAYLDNPHSQATTLFLINSTIFATTCWFASTYSLKRNISLYIYILLAKSLIGMLLIVELYIDFEDFTINIEEQIFISLTTTLIYSIAVMLILQYLLTTVWGFCQELYTTLKAAFRRKVI